MKKKGTLTNVFIVLGCLLILMLAIIGGVALYVWVNEKIESTNAAEVVEIFEEITYSQEEVEAQVASAVEAAVAEAVSGEADRILSGIADGLSDGDTVVETLRPYYPDDIVVVSGGQFHFIPIREDLVRNDLVKENLNILDSGEYQYAVNGEVVSHKGIDVSKHQGEIDWARVGQTDVEYVFIRVGYRGYGNGTMVLDEQFERNIKGALSVGLKVGVYFFSQAITQEEALEEAAFVLEQIAPYKVDYPVVFDVEKVSDSSARMNQLSVTERTDITLTFIKEIEEAGYTPMIYHNMEMGAVLLDLERLEGYDKWFAYYSDKLYYPYEYKIWQYSEKGTIDGINGNVDLNISFTTWGG